MVKCQFCNCFSHFSQIWWMIIRWQTVTKLPLGKIKPKTQKESEVFRLHDSSDLRSTVAVHENYILYSEAYIYRKESDNKNAFHKDAYCPLQLVFFFSGGVSAWSRGVSSWGGVLHGLGGVCWGGGLCRPGPGGGVSTSSGDVLRGWGKGGEGVSARQTRHL